ncbi:MAG: hypothetical protein R3320_11135 [Nitriliruptorales bacterium]|nr:hypothetical protein [Nitriliruptorales bacterium]
MIKRTLLLALTVLLVVGVFAASPAAAEGRGNGPVIFVESQGLYYDSIVTADPLPQEGPFQELRVTDDGLVTDYGPGDTGYAGGRWWVDVNGNGEMDDGDHYFSCPLLGPGRASA